jgi:hypothetical protein
MTFGMIDVNLSTAEDAEDRRKNPVRPGLILLSSVSFVVAS